MPSVELSKLQTMSAARAVSSSDPAQIEARAPAAPRSSASAPGVSIEISAAADPAAPPVNAERVQQIRAALRDGSYPLVPTKIADALIAAQVSLALPERD